MNDEIKEILDAWRNKKYILAYTFNYDSAREQNDKLLDYITNLQQENERLKEENNNKAMNDYAHAIDESWYRELYDDYKYRCEKASELIDLKITRLYHEVDYNLGIEDLKDIENILQNGSDSL